MAKTILMFTWTDVLTALDTLADTPQRRRAAWLLERLKRDSADLAPSELLEEIISSAVLLGAETRVPPPEAAVPGLPGLEFQSLHDA